MDLGRTIDRVQSLSALELATLLCLVTKQHCLVETEKDTIDDVSQELALVSLQRHWHEKAFN
jgi:hypothetical protein